MVSRLLATIFFLILLVGLGVADAKLLGEQAPSIEELNISFLRTGNSGGSGEGPVASNDGTKKGVRKKKSTNVGTALESLPYNAQEATSQSLLEQVVPQTLTLKKQALLQDNDRVGSVIWLQDGNAKQYFLSLKDSLHSSFSSELQDLLDETQRRPGKPIRNYLTFKDTAIHEEQIVFVRIQDRLYEFHIAEGFKEEMNTVIETLSQ